MDMLDNFMSNKEHYIVLFVLELNNCGSEVFIYYEFASFSVSVNFKYSLENCRIVNAVCACGIRTTTI